MASQSSPLNPTWQGHIASTLDALILFEASLDGLLNHVPRRPHDRERQDLIKSGSVFIYEEHASGIKRWTDGVSWSPSRILGNFLIYRELEKPFPPGEKKRALKKKKCSAAGISKSDGASRPGVGNFASAGIEVGKDTERSLIGSLIDSYPFKSDGLVKKTISITYRGVPHHLVSYYNVEDVMTGRLITPLKDPRLRDIVPRLELMTSQNFRAPVDEVEYGPDGAPALFAAVPNGAHDFGGTSGSILQRAWNPNMPAVPVQAYTTAPTFAFPPTPHHSYVSSIGSSLTVPMTSSVPSSLPSSMAPPLMAPPAPASMPSQSTASMSFAPPPRPVANNYGYLHQPSYYMSHRQPSINVKIEANGVTGEEGGSQQYGLDENNPNWGGFDTIEDGSQDQQYFHGHSTGGASQQWQGSSNGIGRT